MPSFDDLIQRLTPACDTRASTVLEHLSQAGFPNNDPLPPSFSGRRFASYIEVLTGAFLNPYSGYKGASAALSAIHRLTDILTHACNPDGTLNGGNFASPPDTAFVVPPLGSALRALTRLAPAQKDTATHLETLLKRLGEPLITGGLHTPNHRWVVCSALSYLYHIFRDPRYLSRIDTWLAEGIDLDPDGHVSERSTAIYAHVTVDALIRMATLLQRPELLASARACLAAVRYFFRPDNTLETTASRRQDQHETPSGNRWYLDYRFMAIHDRNGQFASLARTLEQTDGHNAPSILMRLLEEPMLAQPPPKTTPLPDSYHVFHPHSGIARMREGHLDATLFAGCDGPGPPVSGLARNPTFFRLQKGHAHLCSVRIAPMFFSSGYVQGSHLKVIDGGYHFEQTMTVSYFQPLAPHYRTPDGRYALTSAEDRYHSCLNFPMRDRSEVQSLCFSVQMRRTPSGFTLGLDAVGPIGVPIALELAFPRVGALENVSPCLDDTPNIHFLLSGQGHYRHLGDTLTFGPGSADHRWHPFLAPTGFHWPPDEPASRQYVYIPLLTPVSAVLTLA